MDQTARDELVAASALGCLSQAVAHWFPWNRALGRELQPPYTYIIGVGQIIGLFSGWVGRRRRLTGRDAAIGLLAITSASGISVMLGYTLDWVFGKSFEDRIRWAQIKR